MSARSGAIESRLLATYNSIQQPNPPSGYRSTVSRDLQASECERGAGEGLLIDS